MELLVGGAVVHVEAFAEKRAGGWVEDEEGAEGDAQGNSGGGDAEVIALMRAGDDAFADGAAGHVVGSGDFDVQIGEGGGDGLIELAYAFRSIEFADRDEIEEGARVLDEGQGNIGLLVFVFEADVVGDGVALVLEEMHGGAPGS